MKIKIILLMLAFFPCSLFAQQQKWYADEGKNIPVMIDKFYRFNNKFITEFSFINQGHKYYVAEFKIMHSKGHSFWSSWVGNDWVSWRNRAKGSRHFFSFRRNTGDVFLRIRAIKPEYFENYEAWVKKSSKFIKWPNR